jgi:hypothetical protein
LTLLAASNYAAVIRPLQVLVMVLAVLFFARVLRVAMVQARPPAELTGGRGARSRRRGRGLALEFVEPFERAGERVEIEGVVVVGRATDCELQVSDTYISSHHARFVTDDGDLTIEDLHSTNGTYVNQEMLSGRQLLERGDIVQVGGVIFEVVR